MSMYKEILYISGFNYIETKVCVKKWFSSKKVFSVATCHGLVPWHFILYKGETKQQSQVSVVFNSCSSCYLVTILYYYFVM